MANEKSIVKIHRCRQCRAKKNDPTGKAKFVCCGEEMQMSEAWHVRLTRNGRTTCPPVSTRRQEAVAYLHAAKDAQRRGDLLPGEEGLISWDTAKKKFLAWVDSPSADLKAKTKEFYKDRFAILDKHFQGVAMQDITVAMVNDFKDDRMRVVSPKTTLEEIKVLKRMFALFCAEYSANPRIKNSKPILHAVAQDINNGVKMPELVKRKPDFLTEAQITKLLSECKQAHLKLAVSIALRTGLRLSNIMGMQYKWIDFINRVIRIPGEYMKSGRDFEMPLSTSVVNDIVAWRKAQKRLSPFLFPSPRDINKPVKKMQTTFDAAVARCGFKGVSFHWTRHTFASHFLMAGGLNGTPGDMATLSRLLDHASIQITVDIYGGMSLEHKKKAVDAFEGAMGWGMK